MRQRRFRNRFFLFLALLFALCLTTPLLRSLGYAGPEFIIRAAVILAVLLLCRGIHAYPLLGVALPAVLLPVAGLAYRFTPDIIKKMALNLSNYLAENMLLWPLALLTAAALLVYLCLFILKKPLVPLLAGGLAVLVPLWYLYVDSAYPAAIFYASGWFLLLGYRKGEGLWESLPEGEEGKQRERLRKSWLHYTASVVFTALLLSLIMPKNLAALPLPRLQNRIAQAFPILYELRGGEEIDVRGDGGAFSLYSSGYQQTSRLGGPLLQDTILLLEVRGQGGVYLKGSVKDTYTGRTWQNTAAMAELEEFPPPPEAIRDYLAAVDLRLVHRRLRTRTLFSPQFPQEFRGIAPPWADGNSGITLPVEVPRGLEYRVKGFVIGYRGDFGRLETGEALPGGIDSYLNLPPGLPLRVEELAREVAGAYPGYFQRMKALEGYLRSNFPYTIEAPALPEGRDFVDFFLFDLQEGYCSFFASALAVMGRAAGVPTRYVEGFRVPSEQGQGRFYPVAGINAHAWVEAYIPGLGWLPFEATPAYETAEFLPPPPEPGTGGDAPPPGGDPPPGPGPGDPPFFDPFPDTPEPWVPSPGEGPAAFIRPYLTRVLGAAVLALLLFFLLVLVVRYDRLKKVLAGLQNQAPHRRAVAYYLLALDLLERLGEGKAPGETPREYSRRIIHRVHTWSLNFNEISEGMNLVLYSGQELVPPSLAEEAESFCRFIFDRYLHKVGKWGAISEILLQGKYFDRLTS